MPISCIRQSVILIYSLPTIQSLSERLNRLLDNIPDNEVTNASVIGRLMNNVRTGYYPTDIEHVKYIKNGYCIPGWISV